MVKSGIREITPGNVRGVRDMDQPFACLEFFRIDRSMGKSHTVPVHCKPRAALVRDAEARDAAPDRVLKIEEQRDIFIIT